jgi:hypothetical protein
MNKQIELFKAGTPNVRVYVLPDQWDGVTVVWPYKAGYSSFTYDGQICEHFVNTNCCGYPNPVDSKGTKHLGLKTDWVSLPNKLRDSILYLFPLIWDVHPGNV